MKNNGSLLHSEIEVKKTMHIANKGLKWPVVATQKFSRCSFDICKVIEQSKHCNLIFFVYLTWHENKSLFINVNDTSEIYKTHLDGITY